MVRGVKVRLEQMSFARRAKDAHTALSIAPDPNRVLELYEGVDEGVDTEAVVVLVLDRDGDIPASNPLLGDGNFAEANVGAGDVSHNGSLGVAHGDPGRPGKRVC